MIKRILARIFSTPQPVKTRIGTYVYWTDQYGRVIREQTND
jgi:hypothetical protein